MSDPISAIAPQDTARLQAQKRRNMWLALALVAFVVLVGVSTALRIQETDFTGGDRLYFSGYMDEAASEKADREAQARIEALSQEQATEASNEGQGDE